MAGKCYPSIGNAKINVRVKLPTRSESSIGRSCVEAFEREFPEFEIYKLSSPGNRDVEDYLIIATKGRVGFIELKRPGEKPSERQQAKIDKHRSMGHKANWVDSRGWFIQVVRAWFE
jgi:hypothetical protein